MSPPDLQEDRPARETTFGTDPARLSDALAFRGDHRMGYRVAVVGATGAVGREMMTILEETNFRIDHIHAIASRASINTEVSFGDRLIRCEDIERSTSPRWTSC
jgi:hypothetical protein